MKLALALSLLLPLCAAAQLRVTNTLYLTWDQPDSSTDVVWTVYGTSTIATVTNIPPLPAPPSIISFPTNFLPVAAFPASQVLDIYHPKVALAAMGTNGFLVVTASNIWGETLFSDPVTVPKPIATGRNLKIGL